MKERSETATQGETREPVRDAIRHVNAAARGFSRSYTFGMDIAVAVIAPIFIGRWLDSKTGKEPWFMIGGMLLGAAAAVRSVQRFHRESQEDRREERTGGEGPSD